MSDENAYPVVALPAAERPPMELARRDWSSALDLIEEATEAIRLSEERADDLQRESEELLRQHETEVSVLRGLLTDAHKALESANARAEAAEAHAAEASGWLARIDSALNKGFGRPAASVEAPMETVTRQDYTGRANWTAKAPD